MNASRHNSRFKLVEDDGNHERELYSADDIEQIEQFIKMKQGKHET